MIRAQAFYTKRLTLAAVLERLSKRTLFHQASDTRSSIGVGLFWETRQIPELQNTPS
jgi:hypothetical protein